MLDAARVMAPTLEMGLDVSGCNALERLLVLVIKSECDVDDPQRQSRALVQSKTLFASFWSGSPPCSSWS